MFLAWLIDSLERETVLIIKRLHRGKEQHARHIRQWNSPQNKMESGQKAFFDIQTRQIQRCKSNVENAAMHALPIRERIKLAS
jgi:hypothetical protein